MRCGEENEEEKKILLRNSIHEKTFRVFFVVVDSFSSKRDRREKLIKILVATVEWRLAMGWSKSCDDFGMMSDDGERNRRRHQGELIIIFENPNEQDIQNLIVLPPPKAALITPLPSRLTRILIRFHSHQPFSLEFSSEIRSGKLHIPLMECSSGLGFFPSPTSSCANSKFDFWSMEAFIRYRNWI